MAIKLGAGALVVVLLIVLLQGTLFGGGDDDTPGSSTRRGSIPTATPPANPPEPLLLGEVRGGTGGTTTSGTTGGEGTYTVQSGDTLAGIAIAQNVPADQQAAWLTEVLRLNGIADARSLAVGQQLRLPRVPTPTPSPRPSGTAASTVATPTRTAVPLGTAAGPTSTPITAATPRPTTVPVTGGAGTYTVVSGDFPLLIAEKLGVPAAQQDAWAQQLLTLNNTTAANLQVGQVLQTPAIPSGAAVPTPTRAP